MTAQIQFPDVVQLAVPFFIVALLVEVFALRFARARGNYCLLYTSPSPRDLSTSRMPSSA